MQYVEETPFGRHTVISAQEGALTKQPTRRAKDDVVVNFATTGYMSDGTQVLVTQQDVSLGSSEQHEEADTNRVVRVELNPSMPKEHAVAALGKILEKIKAEGLPPTYLSVPRGAAEKMAKAQKMAAMLYAGLPNLPPEIASAVRAYLDKGVSSECRVR